jgi:hypothetical protein
MNSCALIIPTCRHILPTGRRCLQPAVRRRRCCRHHLDAQARLHNMARARRLASFARLCVPTNLGDVALNRAEVLRVVNSGNVDFTTARMMLWAMDLTAETLRAKPNCRPRRPQNRASNPNGIYDIPLNPLFPQSLSATLPQVLENTQRQGGGVHRSGELPPCLLPAAPSGLKRSERRRLALMSHTEARMTKSERRRAKREAR